MMDGIIGELWYVTRLILCCVIVSMIALTIMPSVILSSVISGIVLTVYRKLDRIV